MNDEAISEHDLMDPMFNFHVASRYLQYQLNRYDGNIDMSISAYNKGHASRTNKAYVDKVKDRLTKYKELIK